MDDWGKDMADRTVGRLSHRLGVVCLLLVACINAGCVSGRTYRTQLHTSDYCIFEAKGDCPQEVLHQVGETPSKSPPVLLGYVEFDDQGYLREPESKENLMRQIRAIDSDRPVLMVVFAHGWKHNAAPDDGNVEAFAQFLRKIAKADAQACENRACAPRQVVGMYLGWRGLSNKVEPFKTLTFWGRKGRAHRVGTDGATEVLAELAKIKATRRNNRLIVTGHSFGGALVYNSLNQLLIRDTAFANKEGTVARNAADLVVLVNPAFEAARFNALQRKASGMTFKPGQMPILAIFTSQADTATKRAFPAGRALATLFSEHSTPEQRRQNIQAIGHYAPYRTHTLMQLATPATVDFKDFACAWKAYSIGTSNRWNVGAVALARTPAKPESSQSSLESARFNPYMVVGVEKGIISGHNEIWGDEFSDFLYRFVAVQRYGGHCGTAEDSTQQEQD
ncbi:alpha/beta hydrolase [Lysobacter capsici]|uniref:alpha/beta hydrolase n=1 Tax=Lysobacter capsici TaxID=435897 RepID=UPI001BFFDFC1|nr:alpha/beta hydrolase [Lysobacter capsici]QWF19607.1 lipase family protein [Lysobacter capsici]